MRRVHWPCPRHCGERMLNGWSAKRDGVSWCCCGQRNDGGGASVLNGGFMMVLLDCLAVLRRGILLVGRSGLGGEGDKTEEKHKNKCVEDGGRFHKYLGETLVGAAVLRAGAEKNSWRKVAEKMSRGRLIEGTPLLPERVLKPGVSPCPVRIWSRKNVFAFKEETGAFLPRFAWTFAKKIFHSKEFGTLDQLSRVFRFRI